MSFLFIMYCIQTVHWFISHLAVTKSGIILMYKFFKLIQIAKIIQLSAEAERENWYSVLIGWELRNPWRWVAGQNSDSTHVSISFNITSMAFWYHLCISFISCVTQDFGWYFTHWPRYPRNLAVGELKCFGGQWYVKLVTELPSVDHSLQFLGTWNLVKTIIRIYEHLTEETTS